MTLGQPARLVRIHICEGDRYAGKPLFEAIVDACREAGIAGATVFRGLEGFAGSSEIHRRQLMGGNEPVVIHVVDTEEHLGAVLPRIENMLGQGLIAISEVEIVRVRERPGEAR